MSLPQRFKRLSFIFGCIVALVGFLVLTGWVGDIMVLKSISPHWISMKANGAICFLLAGITVILVNREKKNTAAKWIASVFSIIIFTVGAITLLEYIFKFNAGIDELFFNDTANAFPQLPPGRQSPFSAAYFMLFGFCYLPGIYGRIRVSIFQMLHIVSGILVLVSAMSYVLGSYIIAGISFNFIFVIHSTVSFLFLIIAVLFSQPEKGYMKLVSSNTIGGKVIRKTLPVFIFIFVVIGWLGLRGEQSGLYNTEFSVSILIILMIIIFGGMLISGAASLANSEVILKQSEEKLILANKTLEAAEKMARLGNWEYNMNGQEGIWSKEIFRLLGLPVADKAPSFKEFLQLIHPDERAPAQEIFDQMLDGIEIESKIFCTNPERGDIKYLLLDWHVIKDMNGRPVKYFGTLQCVTERVKATNTLKQSEELFKKAFHSKIFGLAIVNQERRVVDINETLAGLMEYKREDFIGKTTVEMGLTSPAYTRKRDEILLMVLQNGRIDNYELEIETRLSKRLSLLLSVEPINLNDTSLWLIYLVDVTEKKNAEKELAESENRLRTILETEPECVKLIDINGDLTYMNPAGLAIMEADTLDMIKGKMGYNIINEPYREDFFRLAINVFSGKSGKLEYEITGLKGTPRWLETHVVPLRNVEGKIISLLGVTRDITESKKVAEQIKKYNEQLRQLTAHLQNTREEERKRIGRDFHDELGQHLTVLKIYVSRLQERIKEGKNSDKDIDEIMNQLDNCFKIVRKISLELRPGIIDDLGIIAAFEWQAEEFEKRSNIKTRFLTNVKELILSPAHSIGLFRIFQEALTNIARHSEAKEVNCTLNVRKKTVIITITDNGNGFDKATIGDKKTLGLLGMKERCIMMEGTFDIESARGKGTEITVTVPLQ